MIIDLESIFNVDGLSTDICHEIDMSDEEVDGFLPFTTPVRVEGTVGNMTGIVEIHATASFELDIPCSRCAAPMLLPMEVDIDHTLVRDVNNEDNDDLLVVSELLFDVDPLIREDIILAMPYRFLCSEECKGLCAKCGKNLNEGPCGCQKDIDPRLEVLRQLLDN